MQEAGKELDALIHEKVFGRQTVDPDKLPRYSAETALADEIIEHLRDTKRYWFTVDLGHPRREPENKHWTCTITDSVNLRKLSVVTAKIRAHAICLAALEAVGQASGN